ncbi:MAG: NifB/NifX family molybdenum-iron cluster-binding protein [Planctomycetota bacterium]
MKLCVTSQGPEPSSQVDPRFGRARYFIIYDDKADEYSVVDNEQNLNAASGAGVQAASNVADAGAQLVISGHIGPRAMTVLQEAEVKVVVGAEGTVEEALEAYREGELEEVEDADVPPHW